MQFGLDAAPNKENIDALFFSSANSTPRKRLEAKSYRARDQADNGWFRHGEATSSLTPLKSTDTDQKCCCHCGKDLHMELSTYRKVASPNPGTPKSASRAERQQNRDRVLGYDHCSEWFSHDNQHTPSKGNSAFTNDRGENTASLKKRDFFPDCKDWYRHEHTILCAEDAGIENTCATSNGKLSGFSSPSWWPLAGEVVPKTFASPKPSPSWWPSANEGFTGTLESPKPRVIGQDAERNRQRDHDGSAKEWYHHESTCSDDIRRVLHAGKVQDDASHMVSGGNRDVVCGRCHAAEVILECGSEVRSQCADHRARRALNERFQQVKKDSSCNGSGLGCA